MMRFAASKIQSGARDILAGDLHLDVGGADLVKLLGHDVLREFGFIAFAAQVREVKVAQPVGHDMRGGLGGGEVGEMAVASEDALLEAP